MAKEKHFGRCALCGKECELTFEHIPPRMAFNKDRARVVSGDELLTTLADEERKPWELDGLKYIPHQQGIGKFTLCRDCNSFTGAYYGGEYVNFVRIMAAALYKEQAPSNTEMHIAMQGIEPLKIIKQIASMFCSVNTGIEGNEALEKLKAFVLDKESNAFPIDYFRIGMYLYVGDMTKQCPMTGMIKKGKDGVYYELVSEICSYPIGYMMYFNSDSEQEIPGVDITDFSKCKYGKKYKLTMDIPVYESNTLIPGDFRTKNEILATE